MFAWARRWRALSYEVRVSGRDEVGEESDLVNLPNSFKRMVSIVDL